MKNLTDNNPRIFLTDYASYNNGTQFEFGHWVDLTDFSDESELDDYIENHFKEADVKSPLDSPREEIMITDYENFPSELYGESGCQWDKIFKYIELDFQNLSDEEKISLWNEYCFAQRNEKEIYSFDDDFFETHFSNKPMEAARAASFGTLNWSDDYIRFNGYANLESMSTHEAVNSIDEGALIDWMIENK